MGSFADKAKGHTNDAIGNMKQGIGRMTDNERLQAEGFAQERKGEGQKAVGDVKEAVKKVSRDTDREVHRTL